ncbi:MAG TPA: hypothetical protein VHG09_05675, partial [Longimicrobiales bacterium]|nr:hypothetical protein [Longimicrobiales bacterium]
RLNAEYGEVQPEGSGPSFNCIASHGNHYLSRRYPRLDSIVSARVIVPQAQSGSGLETRPAETP